MSRGTGGPADTAPAANLTSTNIKITDSAQRPGTSPIGSYRKELSQYDWL